MKMLFRPLLVLSVLPLCAVISWTSESRADIPAFYTGTPYMGVAQQIPGRVELADMDMGGIDVAWYADHRRANAVAENYSPISGDDYRPGDLDLPNICKTNKAREVPGIGSEDFWENGERYPSEEEPYSYYMGYAHTVDWVRVTVDVQQAGTYSVSSNWACANLECGLSIWFNDGTEPMEDPEDGNNKSGVIIFEGTNDYHIWRAYPNFATVQLNAGLQLMTFHLERADHLQYGFLQFDLVGGDADAGAGGNGGDPDAGAVGGAAGSEAGGSGGTAGTDGSGTAGASDPGTGGTSGAAGSTNTTAGTAGATNPDTSEEEEKDDSGCAVAAPSHRSSSDFAGLGLLVGALALWRKRRAAAIQ